MKLFNRAHVLLPLLSLAAGCTDRASAVDGIFSEVDAAPHLADDAFGACPPGYQAECAFLEVPLDHAHAATSETIKVMIARRKATTKATRQLWLLSGGPGQAGSVFNGTVSDFAARIPDADIFVIDHRGTGNSHRLACAAQDVPGSGGGYVLAPTAVPACLEELKTKGDFDRLPFFTSAAAARDLASAIVATRTPEQKVYLWGGSYGTHWAHRFLQIAPDLADGIVFDGYMTPQRFAFTDYDKGIDEVGGIFAQGCSADATCAAHFGADATGKTRAILDHLATKPCGPFDRDTARTYASVFLEGVFTRAWVFPFLHRLERCSTDDLAAVDTLLKNFTHVLGGDAPTGEAPPEVFTGSGILQYNIVLSELWSTPGQPVPSRAELEARAASQLFLAGGSYAAPLVDVRPSWPLPPDDYTSLPTPVTSRTALLWLAGGLDPRTPPAQARRVSEIYPNATMVMLPGAGHTPATASPLASDPRVSCGSKIIEAFVARDVVDTSCTSDLFRTLYESPNAAFAQAWWGNGDDWGDGTAKPAAPGPVPPVRINPSIPARIALRALRVH